MRRLFWYWSLVSICLLGCMESLDKQVQKSPDSNIHKKTQDIGEFKPEAGAQVSDSKVVISDPFLGPVQAMGPMKEQLSKLGIQHAVDLFHATEGRYPESHEEFMMRIVKENNMQLPELPGGKKYQYDVANHELVVVEAPNAEPAAQP
jgi:hypothetical protein